MISYKPLQETLVKKNVTIQMLEDMLHHYDLKEKLNQKKYISLKTVDKICNALKCDITDVISWTSGEQVVEDRIYALFVKLDWKKIEQVNHFPTLKELSLDMGRKIYYLNNLRRRKWVGIKVAENIASYLSKYSKDKISVNDIISERRNGRATGGADEQKAGTE